ncbi:MAG: diguanylate cyclase [Candidatus Velthaea sp.]
MTLTAALQPAATAVALAFGAGASLAALRARAAARADRLALRLAREREVAFVDAARRLADAARASIDDVRVEIDRAVRGVAPAVDAVLIFEERDAQLACVAAFGERVGYFAGMRLALDDADALVTRAIARAHRVLLADERGARPLHPGDGCAAAIPLVLAAGRTCVLYAAAPGGVTAEDVDRIVALVDQATPAYRIALERADDRARAEYDGLTGLLSPRAFRTRLTDLVERARFAPLGRVALLFIDTDRFKTWNDTFGHASGDTLLREIAALLRAGALGEGDLVARNGGDEFCLVFAATEKSRAIERAGEVRRRIAALDVRALRPAGADRDVNISASIGVACFPVDAATSNALLEKADEAMYHSKRNGRNAVSYFRVDGALVRAEETASAAR